MTQQPIGSTQTWAPSCSRKANRLKLPSPSVELCPKLTRDFDNRFYAHAIYFDFVQTPRATCVDFEEEHAVEVIQNLAQRCLKMSLSFLFRARRSEESIRAFY